MLGDLTPDEPLTAIHLYRRDLANAHPPTAEGTIADGTEVRAKAGDQEARFALLLSLQNYVQYWAARYARAYSWASPRIEYTELISEGNAAMVERMERAATCEKMTGALAAIARHAMIRFCWRNASSITSPIVDSRPKPALPVTSLDAPIFQEEDATLADTLPGPPVVLTNEEQAPALSPEALTTALSFLTEDCQDILTRLYGLGEHAPESSCDIARTLYGNPRKSGVVANRHKQAVARLRSILEAPYNEAGEPDLCTVKQAAQRLGLSAKSTGQELARQNIRPVAFALYPRSAVEALAQERDQREGRRAQDTRTPERKRQGSKAHSTAKNHAEQQAPHNEVYA